MVQSKFVKQILYTYLIKLIFILKYTMSHIVFDSPKFKRWKQRVEVSGNIIKDIKILGFVSRDHVNLFGAFLDCKLITPEGVEIPRCVVIGGDSVVIIPVLTCVEDGEIYTLLVEQRRIIDGSIIREFPSGGISHNRDDLKAVACLEVKEELHMDVTSDELIPLGSGPVMMNPSASGDLAYFFYFERKVPNSFLQKMNGLSTGCHDDHEYIMVSVQKMSEAACSCVSSLLIGTKLLEKAMNRVF